MSFLIRVVRPTCWRISTRGIRIRISHDELLVIVHMREPRGEGKTAVEGEVAHAGDQLHVDLIDGLVHGILDLPRVHDRTEAETGSVEVPEVKKDTSDIPIASDFGGKLRLDDLELLHRHAGSPLATENGHPCLHGRQLAGVGGQARAGPEQLHQVSLGDVGHLESPWDVRFVHDVAHGRARQHECVATHVIDQTVIVLHGVFERQLIGVV